MGNRRTGRLIVFAIVAVAAAALFAFSPVIGPILASAPAGFRAAERPAPVSGVPASAARLPPA